MIKGAIFDIDGTILDSMQIWNTAGQDYLRSLGYEPKDNLAEKFKSFSLYQAAVYFVEEYGVDRSVSEIMDGINKFVENFYFNEVKLKPHVDSFLKNLYLRGVKMCIATATDEYLVKSALERLGVLDYFSKIFTCTDVGHGKDEPIIFRLAIDFLGTEKENTFIFEDSVYAARTATCDGFNVVGIRDENQGDQSELEKISSYFITDYSDFEGFWKEI